MGKLLQKDFYARNTLVVAKELLGCTLCRNIDNRIYKGMVVETEAYTQDDAACHAYKGRTKRCESLFALPGTAYVYRIYGIHYCLNTVTDKKDYGSGVLIRALEPYDNMLDTNGPAKLCKALQITLEDNAKDLTDPASGLWLEYGRKIDEFEIITTTRIGIKNNSDYLWRFYIKNNNWVSKK